MVYPELRQIDSPDLLPPAMPSDPVDCAVRLRIVVGPLGAPEVESEAFVFTAVTPAHLAHIAGATWGRGLVCLPVFAWNDLGQAIAELLARVSRPSWSEVVAELTKELQWVPHDQGIGEASGA